MHVMPTLPLKLTPPCLELTIFLLTCLSFTPAIGIFSHKGLPFSHQGIPFGPKVHLLKIL